jgi:hypothetical protein
MDTSNVERLVAMFFNLSEDEKDRFTEIIFSDRNDDAQNEYDASEMEFDSGASNNNPISAALTKLLRDLIATDNSTTPVAKPVTVARYATYALEEASRPFPPSVRNILLREWAMDLKLWPQNKSTLQEQALVSTGLLYNHIITVLDNELEKLQTKLISEPPANSTDLNDNKFSTLKDMKDALVVNLTVLFQDVRNVILAQPPASGSLQTLSLCLERDKNLTLEQRREIDAIDTFEERHDAIWDEWRTHWSTENGTQQNAEAAWDDLEKRLEAFVDREMADAVQAAAPVEDLM